MLYGYEPEPPLDPPEPDIMDVCRHCGDFIYEGDEMVEFDDFSYHDDCFRECAADILIEQYGAYKHCAEIDRGFCIHI